MPEETQKIQAEQPKLHQPPPPTNTTVDGKEYTPARQDLRPQDVSLIENFIGGIYGEAKQIENNNIGDNKFTKAVKMDAAKEIMNVRNIARGAAVQPAPPQSVPQSVPQPVQPTQQSAIPTSPIVNQHIPVSNPNDSLILKHEIDQLKDQVKDIKRVYDEFVKLKTVKGKWLIKTGTKTQTTPTISKTWNTLTKLLKNKTKSITIEYVEDE